MDFSTWVKFWLAATSTSHQCNAIHTRSRITADSANECRYKKTPKNSSRYRLHAKYSMCLFCLTNDLTRKQTTTLWASDLALTRFKAQLLLLCTLQAPKKVRSPCYLMCKLTLRKTKQPKRVLANLRSSIQTHFSKTKTTVATNNLCPTNLKNLTLANWKFKTCFWRTNKSKSN